jgi:NADH:ubiquinone oxidoreductase subunit K
VNAFAQNFWTYTVAATLCFTAGVYCMAVSRNLIRVLIGMELLTKAVTLMLVLAGAVTGRTGLAQALVITLIVVEVVAISVGAGIVVAVYRKHGSVDARALMELKG